MRVKTATRNQRRLAGLGLVAVLLTGALLWQLRPGEVPGDARAEVPRSGLTLYPGDAGIPLPNVTGKTLDGARLDLADLRGNVVVLNVWGSWCAPCREESPDLVQVASETQDRAVRFVGIDVRDNPAAAKAYERTFGITYPSFDDQDGTILAQFSGIIPVSAVPSTAVIDKQGVVRARVVGIIDATTLRGLIEDTEKLK